MDIHEYCSDVDPALTLETTAPWELLAYLEERLVQIQQTLSSDYEIHDGIAVHTSAQIDSTATIKGPAIIGPDCFVGPHTLVRAGVYLVSEVSVGPGCEIKHSFIGPGTAFAHFNFVGDSVIGSRVNLEAGAIIANHYNEREDKRIFALVNDIKTDIGLTKFGAIIGDDTKIGANAVTSPGTILPKNSVVRRLELVEQVEP